MIYNKEVNTSIALNNISVYDACEQAKTKLGLITKQSKDTHSQNLSVSQKNFPFLPTSSAKDSYELRWIGGSSSPPAKSNNSWQDKTLRTYSRNNVSGSLSGQHLPESHTVPAADSLSHRVSTSVKPPIHSTTKLISFSASTDKLRNTGKNKPNVSKLQLKQPKLLTPSSSTSYKSKNEQ